MLRALASLGSSPFGSTAAYSTLSNVERSEGLRLLSRAFYNRGHRVAKVDPLGLQVTPLLTELDPKTYGFDEADMDVPVHLPAIGSSPAETVTPRQFVERYRRMYCDTVGVEFMHITSREECDWLRSRIEQSYAPFTKEEHMTLLQRLVEAESFENFLALKFSSTKRFGLDGGESLIPALLSMIDEATTLGVDSISIGMPHRGRLNVLTNVVQKPLEVIFSEFAGSDPNMFGGSGDVKYHLGTSVDREVGGRKVHLSLVANPSHLEAVNPIVLGKVRAKQELRGDVSREKNLGVLIHGDAAFSGQGITYETMHLSHLPNYSSGGVIHVVVNNQVGFTTDPHDGRSSENCTDVAKTVGVPVCHVNADDPVSVARIMKVATQYRLRFKKDVVVDLVCYRRNGHNEQDQPKFTQPLMYNVIEKLPSTATQYARSLTSAGIITVAESKALEDSIKRRLEEAFQAAKTHTFNVKDWLDTRWRGYKKRYASDRVKAATSLNPEAVPLLTEALTTIPQGFTAHPTVARVLSAKKKSLESGTGIDWATGEALAFGSLLLEGFNVRMSGQDVQRGTFSHRHAVITDQTNGSKYTLLDSLKGRTGVARFYNSPLDEFAVLGFELGYAMESPANLVLWEAQFGDFANGAQVIFDQFISSGEQKWMRQAGLICLLPHGYDGQGPEHSSARLERFLALSDQDQTVVPSGKTNEDVVKDTNLVVYNITTAANYFHMLRRQIHRSFQKPAIVMSPKSLLRNPSACSNLSDFTDTSVSFRPIIEDSLAAVAPEAVRRLVFCSGQVYYDLVGAIQTQKIQDIAVVRVEQLAPFPMVDVAAQVARYPQAEVMWTQEEPQNMGAWKHVQQAMIPILANHKQRLPSYAGRQPMSAASAGRSADHTREKAEFLKAATKV